MIRNIKGYGFWGFYETLFSNSDDFIDDEYEIKEELVKLVGNENFTVEVSIDDFDTYKKDVCREYMKQYITKVYELLPFWITDFDFFKFEYVDKEDNITVTSPKYYNYTTDKCYCDISTNVETLNLIKWYVLNLKGAKEFIEENYIPFTKRDITVWKHIQAKNYEEQYLDNLLGMLLELDDNEEIIDDLNVSVYEEIEKWAYTVTDVYYNGKKYDVCDFRKKFE